jgi:ATP-dependent RNA helicase DDX5/DBP2
MGKQYRSGKKRTREDQDEMKFRQFKLKHGQDPDQPRTSTQAKKKPRKFDRKAQKMLSKEDDILQMMIAQQENEEEAVSSEDAGNDSDAVAEQSDGLEEDPIEFRKANEIRVTGLAADGYSKYQAPNHIYSFDMAPFSTPIKTALASAGFAVPTTIQAQSWPICIEGRDIISVAKTGSGKTCGFLLPMFHLLEKNRSKKLSAAEKRRMRLERAADEEDSLASQVNQSASTKIIVMAPTRELASQIHDEAKRFGRSASIKSVCLFGGVEKKQQIAELRRDKPGIIVATPGRLNDLLAGGWGERWGWGDGVSGVQFLVLDEADRMVSRRQTF